jgi:hypothetical protein
MKAVELISFDNLSPEERTKAKNKEAARIVLTKERMAEKIEIAKNLISLGSNNEFIAKATELTIEQVAQLRSETE